MNQDRKAKKELHRQIADELSELTIPTEVASDVWAKVLRMPVAAEKKEAKKGHGRTVRKQDD